MRFKHKKNKSSFFIGWKTLSCSFIIQTGFITLFLSHPPSLHIHFVYVRIHPQCPPHFTFYHLSGCAVYCRRGKFVYSCFDAHNICVPWVWRFCCCGWKILLTYLFFVYINVCQLVCVFFNSIKLNFPLWKLFSVDSVEV